MCRYFYINIVLNNQKVSFHQHVFNFFLQIALHTYSVGLLENIFEGQPCCYLYHALNIFAYF